MSKMRVIALGGALVCAIVAGLMVRSLISRKQEVKSAEVINTVETVDVLVATKDMSMGEKLGTAIVWKASPKDNITPIMIARSKDKPDQLKVMAQARVRLPIYKDEPVMDKKILQPGAGGLMSASLPKGMRALSVAISPRSSAGGFILPNDRVDVILTTKSQVASSGGASGSSTPTTSVKSETVISNVRVLAVNQVFKQASDTDPVTVEKGENATLELSASQSEIIAQVESTGELSLALRSIAENDGKTPEEIVPVLADKYQGKAERKSGDPLFVRAGVESYAKAQ